MKHPQLRDFNRRVQRLLARNKTASSAAARIERISGEFLGRSYVNSPLTGSAETAEVFAVSLDGFDCVTYIETVLALSLAGAANEFVECLREIRYEDGRVEWRRRNHYMTAWIRNNIRAGVVRRISPRVPRASKHRILNVVPGLPPVRMRFDCIPKAFVPRVSSSLKTGDLIFFASTQRHLDVFHCGILVRRGERLLLRHAARSRNGVVEQELPEFLKANRMAGVILVRPVEAGKANPA